MNGSEWLTGAIFGCLWQACIGFTEELRGCSKWETGRDNEENEGLERDSGGPCAGFTAGNSEEVLREPVGHFTFGWSLGLKD